MASASDWITTKQTGDVTEIFLSGHWSLRDAGTIDAFAPKIDLASSRAAILDVGAIEDLDTTGAWLVEKLRRRLSSAELPASLRNVKANHSVLLDRIGTLAEGPAEEPATHGALYAIAGRTGKATIDTVAEAADLQEFQAEYLGEGPPRVRVRLNAKLVRMPQRTIVAT